MTALAGSDVVIADVAAADVNVDGLVDIVVFGTNGVVMWYENLGGSQSRAFVLPQSQHFVSDEVGEVQAVTIGDIDGDGDPDIGIARSVMC